MLLLLTDDMVKEIQLMTKKNNLGVSGTVIILCLFVFIPQSEAVTSPTWIQLKPAANKIPQLNVVRSDFTQIDIEVKIPGIWSEEISTAGGTYSSISLPSAGVTTEISRPSLPVISRMVQIPFGADVSLNLVSYESTEKSLSELELTRPIVPVQPSVPKIAGAERQIRFALDQNYYKQDVFMPEKPVELGKIGVIRGHRFVTVLVYPVSYNPK
jgi:hypothetical protein